MLSRFGRKTQPVGVVERGRGSKRAWGQGAGGELSLGGNGLVTDSHRRL